VSLRSGSYRLGPDNATLSVRTGRAGAAAKAGHDLTMHVTAWEATIEAGEDPGQTTMRLTADPSSLRVREGTGGMQDLGEDDIDSIHRTIDDEVLLRREIEFRSLRVSEAPGGLSVEGELTLAGSTEPISFELTVGDEGELSAEAVVSQPDWGMKPYSTLFGALKVHEDVRVRLEGQSR
jgi:polyisoprenoid-binding protein YceI